MCKNCEAVLTPKRKPEHAAVRSKATALWAPTSRATCGASPNRSSGLDVEKMTRSMSSAETPAISIARSAALAPRSESVSPGASRCRLLMPVRCAIHSSEVSTTASRSAFVTTVSGAHEPIPMSRDLSFALPSDATTGLRTRQARWCGRRTRLLLNFSWAAALHAPAAHPLRLRALAWCRTDVQVRLEGREARDDASIGEQHRRRPGR